MQWSTQTHTHASNLRMRLFRESRSESPDHARQSVWFAKWFKFCVSVSVSIANVCDRAICIAKKDEDSADDRGFYMGMKSHELGFFKLVQVKSLLINAKLVNLKMKLTFIKICRSLKKWRYKWQWNMKVKDIYIKVNNKYILKISVRWERSYIPNINIHIFDTAIKITNIWIKISRIYFYRFINAVFDLSKARMPIPNITSFYSPPRNLQLLG